MTEKHAEHTRTPKNVIVDFQLLKIYGSYGQNKNILSVKLLKSKGTVNEKKLFHVTVLKQLRHTSG